MTAEPPQPGLVGLPPPWRILLGVATLVVISLATLNDARHASPAHLGGVVAVLAVFVAGWLTFLVGRYEGGRAVLACLVLMGSSLALSALTSGGQGVVAIYAILMVAPLRLAPRAAVGVAIPAVTALVFVSTRGDPHALADGALVAIGGVFFFAVSVVTARTRAESRRNARLLAELRESRAAEARSAVLAERARLSRELHDVLAHTLSGLALHLESTRVLARRGGADPELQARLERAVHLARAGLDEARGAVSALRDESLPGPERLAELVADFERQSHVPCRLIVHGEPRALPPESRVALFRAAQEALTNVRKHASPTAVEVVVDWRPAEVLLRVVDAGSPRIAERQPDGGGLGLVGMRERAGLAGGALTAAPTPDGFAVELRLPA